jgi:hypothetical protein
MVFVGFMKKGTLAGGKPTVKTLATSYARFDEFVVKEKNGDSKVA